MKKIFPLLFLLLTNLGYAEYISIGGGSNNLPTNCTNGQLVSWNSSTRAWDTCLTGSGTGTVTTVNTDSSTSSIFNNTTNVIGTTTVTLSLLTQAKNTVFAGPTTGSNAAPTYRLLVGADLPTFTGDVTNVGAAMTVAKIQTTTVSGTTGTGNVVFSASPTLTGTIVAAAATFSGDVKSSSNCYLTPKESDLGNSGSSLAIDLSTATVFTITLNAATPTLTFSNPVAGCAYALVLTQDGSGSKVPTWAGTSVIWGNTGTKTLSTTASAVDKISCVYNGNITKLMCDLGVAYQ